MIDARAAALLRIDRASAWTMAELGDSGEVVWKKDGREAQPSPYGVELCPRVHHA